MDPTSGMSIDRTRAFCERWGVAEFSLFGSVLREADFGLQSDVDVLIAYLPGRRPTLEEWLAQCEELKGLFAGRAIDLVERRAVVNPYRRYEILTTRRVLYAA